MFRVTRLLALTVLILVSNLSSTLANLRKESFNECPRITVECPTDIVGIGSPVIFKANISGSNPTKNQTLHWTISAGTIVSGQGTSSITVNTAGLGGQPIEASVKVDGFPLECSSKASCTRQLAYIDYHRLFDKYGHINLAEEKARLDNLAIVLRNELDAIAYLVVYGGRRMRIGEIQRGANRARDHLIRVHKIEANRIVTMNGGHHEEFTVEIWLGVKGGPMPTVLPTVDPKEVRIIRNKRAGNRGRRTRRKP